MSFEVWTFARGYLGRVMECICLGREERFRDMHCYRGTHKSKKNGRSGACSLPDKQYVRVIYGGGIDVRLVPYWKKGAFVWMDTLRWCAVRMSSSHRWNHACDGDVWFWVDPDGIRPE